MAKKVKSGRRRPAKPSTKAPETHEIFTAKRLIIFFAALEILIIALMYPTFHGRWHMNHAKWAAKKRGFKTAYKHYRWLEKHTPAPKSATFNLEMGNVCMALKQYNEAIGYLGKAVVLTKGQKGINSLLGRAYLSAGNVSEARRCFLKELETNPTDPPANFRLGELAFKEKKYTEATAYFSRVAFLPGYRNKIKPYWKTIEKEVLER